MDSLRKIVERAQSLYSLPAVATRVLQLTADEQIDTRALKDCIECDPALTSKILRVVNSPIYGLQHEVSDLNQALALLGTKPLKLLVLGFSLPDELLAELAGEQLTWYWTNTLTRAVAARELCESVWHRNGDDAFIAGLLYDIGILVLLQELGEPYAGFLRQVCVDRADLPALERDALGFDHAELTAALLEYWMMPPALVLAVRTAGRPATIGRLDADDVDHAQQLHLANMVVELVAGRRLDVLPTLLEYGEKYRGLTQPKLKDLVARVEPKVDELANVLCLDLDEGRDYSQILLDAHRQMSVVSEQIDWRREREPSANEEDRQVLSESAKLATEVADFLRPADGKDDTPAEESCTRARLTPHAGSPTRWQGSRTVDLTDQLVTFVGQARSHRQECSLLLVEIEDYEQLIEGLDTESVSRVLGQLERTCRLLGGQEATAIRQSAASWALLLPDCDRRDAVQLASEVIARLEGRGPARATFELPCRITMNVGVATVAVPPKSFRAEKLWESARRCLDAARASSGHAVKSIEVC